MLINDYRFTFGAVALNDLNLENIKNYLEGKIPQIKEVFKHKTFESVKIRPTDTIIKNEYHDIIIACSFLKDFGVYDTLYFIPLNQVYCHFVSNVGTKDYFLYRLLDDFVEDENKKKQILQNIYIMMKNDINDFIHFNIAGKEEEELKENKSINYFSVDREDIVEYVKNIEREKSQLEKGIDYGD